MENNKIVVFDLDDTLYKELDFLKSAYKQIATTIGNHTKKDINVIYKSMLAKYNAKEDVFYYLTQQYRALGLSKNDLIEKYRNHFPNISLGNQNLELLNYLKGRKITLGIITDGRSIQQRNKLKALEIETFFSDIIISEEFGSEKPDPANFKFFQEKYRKNDYFYIGDNTKKDFISPNALGWNTICLLDDGNNIHRQDFLLPKTHLPKYRVNSLIECKNYL